MPRTLPRLRAVARTPPVPPASRAADPIRALLLGDRKTPPPARANSHASVGRGACGPSRVSSPVPSASRPIPTVAGRADPTRSDSQPLPGAQTAIARAEITSPAPRRRPQALDEIERQQEQEAVQADEVQQVAEASGGKPPANLRPRGCFPAGAFHSPGTLTFAAARPRRPGAAGRRGPGRRACSHRIRGRP